MGLERVERWMAECIMQNMLNIADRRGQNDTEFLEAFKAWATSTHTNILDANDICCALAERDYPMPWEGGDVALLGSVGFTSLSRDSRN